jgi:hypothetical protein
VSKGGKKTNQTSAVDPATAAYVQQVRNMALGMAGGGQQQQYTGLFRPDPRPSGVMGMDPGQLASQYMNPYQQQVIDATRGEYDHLRGQASMASDQAATQAGAFGGSRHGIMEGARLGEIDRAQGSTIADLLASGYNNALGFGQNQQQMGMNFLNMGMGPLGMTSNSTEKGSANPVMDLLGLGLTGYGMYKGGGGGAPVAMPPSGGGMPAPPGSGGMAYTPYRPRTFG